MTRIIPLSQLTNSSELQAQVSSGVVSIGNFDGVHLGHATLLRTTRKLADALGGPVVAVVFDPHPAAILRPNHVPPKLTSIERRAELMSRYGVDALVVCETTLEFLRLTAEQFFESLVVGQLKAAAMVEGPNFFFGRDRRGDIAVLKDLCGQHGIKLEIVAAKSLAASEVESAMISSTRIRGLLEDGEVAEAAELLGAPYRLQGEVVAGDRRGREIGFPTANLSGIDVVVPAQGVYAGVASVGQRVSDRSKRGPTNHQAAIHIGPNPTFDSDGDVKVEVHLIDFDGDLYNQPLMVDFVARVRDIARFDSPGNLIAQINRDIQSVRSLLD